MQEKYYCDIWTVILKESKCLDGDIRKDILDVASHWDDIYGIYRRNVTIESQFLVQEHNS